jgi:peptide deformylase
MTIREIITVPNPLLKTISEPVKVIDNEVLSLIDDMIETMYAAPGIGLAAIQVGVPKRILVIDIARDDDARNPLSFINPEIIDPTETLNSFEEGCLSVPGVWEEIERPDECTVKFLDKDGVEQSIRCKGMLATVIQHEMDHLNGVVFVDHLSKLKRDRAVKKSIKSRTSEKDNNE